MRKKICWESMPNVYSELSVKVLLLLGGNKEMGIEWVQESVYSSEGDRPSGLEIILTPPHIHKNAYITLACLQSGVISAKKITFTHSKNTTEYLYGLFYRALCFPTCYLILGLETSLYKSLIYIMKLSFTYKTKEIILNLKNILWKIKFIVVWMSIIHNNRNKTYLVIALWLLCIRVLS